MTDNEYICKAVELAVGWNCDVANYCAVAPDGEYWHWACNTAKGEIYRDALAAQLVRQVDALPAPSPDYVRRSIMGIWADSVSLIEFKGGSYDETLIETDDADRTMNTIKAVVDSGVLSQPPHGDGDEGAGR